MNIRTFKPSGTVLIAAVALVIGLEAPAAAHQVAQQISGSTIKVHSIAGNRLKNNTVTGKQIKESTLGTVRRATEATKLPALVWHQVTLTNSWAATNSVYGLPEWAKDAQGIVHLRGFVSGGTGGVSAFALPVAERPAHYADVPILTNNSQLSYLGIFSDGTVNPFDVGTSSVHSGVFLNGVTFSTG
jgi:hypothetical protein